MSLSLCPRWGNKNVFIYFIDLIINCWNTECPEFGVLLFISSVRPAVVEVKVLLCGVCTFHCDCAGIAGQAFQYSGSVAYLFPLTVVTVLEGDAVCMSD